MKNTFIKKPWSREALYSWAFLGAAMVLFALTAIAASGTSSVSDGMNLDWAYFIVKHDLGWLVDALDGLQGLMLLVPVLLGLVSVFFSAKYGVIALKKTATGEYRGRMLALVSITLVIGTVVISILALLNLIPLFGVNQ
ncbi:MAG: hypothetical protein Q8R36_00615 [bacterium]|nr:hypothetical protein [bacterium]